jgi:hypothetical protein
MTASLAAIARPLAATSNLHVPIRTRIPGARPPLRNRRDRILNWLALLALVSLGVVWPPVFAALATLPDVHAIQPGGLLRLSRPQIRIAGAGITPPQPAARTAANSSH